MGREIGTISKPRHLFLSSVYGDKTKESERNISIRSLDIALLILSNYKKGTSSTERVPKASSLTISGIVQDS